MGPGVAELSRTESQRGVLKEGCPPARARTVAMPLQGLGGQKGLTCCFRLLAQPWLLWSVVLCPGPWVLDQVLPGLWKQSMFSGL